MKKKKDYKKMYKMRITKEEKNKIKIFILETVKEEFVDMNYHLDTCESIDEKEINNEIKISIEVEVNFKSEYEDIAKTCFVVLKIYNDRKYLIKERISENYPVRYIDDKEYLCFCNVYYDKDLIKEVMNKIDDLAIF